MKPVIVSVFGGSIPLPGEPAYIQAYELGRFLARRGYSVMNGGYVGSMEAVSKGASEEGGVVIGVTCDEIESWRSNKPNAWIKEETRLPRLTDRLFFLVGKCDSAIALPGGVGTLAEIAVLWSLLLTDVLPPKPFFLIGKGWDRTFQELYKQLGAYIPEIDREWLKFVRDIEELAPHFPLVEMI